MTLSVETQGHVLAEMQKMAAADETFGDTTQFCIMSIYEVICGGSSGDFELDFK